MEENSEFILRMIDWLALPSNIAISLVLDTQAT